MYIEKESIRKYFNGIVSNRADTKSWFSFARDPIYDKDNIYEDKDNICMRNVLRKSIGNLRDLLWYINRSNLCGGSNQYYNILSILIFLICSILFVILHIYLKSSSCNKQKKSIYVKIILIIIIKIIVTLYILITKMRNVILRNTTLSRNKRKKDVTLSRRIKKRLI